MDEHLEPDLAALDGALESAERDARALTAGLAESDAARRPGASSWSIVECLDHLARANRAYLAAMQPGAARALRTGRHRRRAAVPGLIGRWFVRSQEPPPRFKSRAPRTIQPQTAVTLPEAVSAFLASHAEVRRFIRTYASIDLAGISFPNPFIRGVRFSLATGLHVIAAHERRHLWQASQVRAALARSGRFDLAS